MAFIYYGLAVSWIRRCQDLYDHISNNGYISTFFSFTTALWILWIVMSGEEVLSNSGIDDAILLAFQNQYFYFVTISYFDMTIYAYFVSVQFRSFNFIFGYSLCFCFFNHTFVTTFVIFSMYTSFLYRLLFVVYSEETLYCILFVPIVRYLIKGRLFQVFCFSI